MHFDEFTEQLPRPFNNTTLYSSIERLLIYRAIKPEECINAIKSFIFSKLGEFYLNPPLFNLKNVFKESEPLKPLIFILSPGNDPLSLLKAFATSRGVNLSILSLGKGQGERASRAI